MRARTYIGFMTSNKGGVVIPFTIDLRARPAPEFRIDAFTVPAESRDAFDAAMQRNLAFIKRLPGFLHHMVFEKSDGSTAFNVMTIAVWDGPGAIAAAKLKVRAYYESIGFDMSAEFARLGIAASLGFYRAAE